MEKKAKNTKTSIGGQAVIEGVMMRGESSMATAVRDEKGSVLVEAKRIKPLQKRSAFLKLPIIRGVVAFFTSLIGGTKVLTRSASVFGEDESSKFDDWLSKKIGVSAVDVAVFFGVILGVALSVFLFFFLPQWLTDFIPFIEKSSIWYFLVEGLIRILIFICYILLTSLLKDVRRTYMYHGAEHKTISCYENGLELTVDNVKTCSRVHDRCGTTFTFIVMVVSILLFALLNYILSYFGIVFDGKFGKLYRFLVKLATLPLVAGVSYEILKLLAKSSAKWLTIFKAPGLLLQKITTREPTDDMIEVAITAFNKVLEMDGDQSVPETEFNVFGSVSTLLKKVKNILNKKSVDLVDGEWIVSKVTGVSRSALASCNNSVTKEQSNLALSYANKRASGIPLQYVFGDTDFYGFNLIVNESVLIPRPETEELVNLAISKISSSSKVLDLCTGSGAIAIAVNKLTGASLTAVDISEKALEVAKTNAEKNNSNIKFIKSNMFENITEKYDVILSNPPYLTKKDIKNLQREVKFEPLIALDGGDDGLNFYKIIANNAYNYLSDGGFILLECGQNQSKDIVDIFNNVNKYGSCEVFNDLNGIDRIVKVNKC